MAKQNNQTSAQTPVEETLSKHEAFFLKYQKQIIGAVVAFVVIVAGCILYHNYVSVPNTQ